jgi:AraC-like DNA-binding protein
MMRELHLVEVPPKSDLEPYVGVLYCANVAIAGMAPERKCILLPNPCVDLVINLGGPFSMEHAGDAQAVGTLASLHGPHSVSAHLRRQGALCLLGARLKHGVAATFLNFPVKEICNRFIPVETFWPLASSELVEPILAAPTIRAKMVAMEKSLTRFFTRARRLDLTLRKAVKLVAQHQGDVEVTELARQLKISRQTVKHKFDNAIGLSPKTFGKLRRFQNVLRCISSDTNINWSELAQRCGYYDQAHLIREFNSFTGFSPEKFLRVLGKGEDLYFFEGADLTHFHMAHRFKTLAGIS